MSNSSPSNVVAWGPGQNHGLAFFRCGNDGCLVQGHVFEREHNQHEQHEAPTECPFCHKPAKFLRYLTHGERLVGPMLRAIKKFKEENPE